MSESPLVSVIVPALDEDEQLPEVLDHLDRLPGRWEVVVAQGEGRAKQLNAAAARAEGEILLFLHADSRLPAGAYASLASLAPEVAGGNFDLRFEGEDAFARVLTRAYALQRRFGFYYGDSSIWARRSAFAALGGYRDLPIMDDYDFVRRLERSFPTERLPGPATTSSRRWRALGVPRTLMSWWVIRLLYVAGVPAERLAGLYRRVR